MLLAIDIGNTSTSFGVFNDEILSHSFFCKTTLLKNIHPCESIFKEHHLHSNSVSRVAIASVVPKITPAVISFITEYFLNPYIVEVSPDIKTGLSFDVDDPREIGADRIANAVAAYHEFHKTCLVIDLGTATTFDYITNDGVYEGGLIIPGVQTSFDNLFELAAQLDITTLEKPKTVIGKNTKEHIQSGFYYCTSALIDGTILMIEKEIQQALFVIATGGFSSIFQDACMHIHHTDLNLTLKGLQIIHTLNS